MISEHGLIYIHKIQTTHTPVVIYEMYNTQTKPKRTKTTLRPKYTPKSNKLNNSLFYKFTEIYNSLPEELRFIESKKFPTQIKLHININLVPYSFPTSQNDINSDSDS